jgi:hypothetical protein
MKTITKPIYRLEELPKKKQDKIIDRLRDEMKYPWYDDNKAVLDEFEEIFPVKIESWEYEYNEYIGFKLLVNDDILDLKGLRLRKWIINNFYNDLFAPKYMFKNMKHRYSKCQKEENILTGYCIGYDILKPIFDFLKNPDETTNVYTLMKKCLYTWIKSCSSDHQWFYSDSGVKEYIENNDLWFNEKGGIEYD